ncbi:MAG TPA: hypothetical protein VMT19_11370 [Thermoanaerobaculaceae bacterium]|nr:hypothetical protein [Thermoanaerobaculaceae bacterium]
MRRLALALAAWLAATVAAGETFKTLTMSRPAEGLASVTVKAGLGDIEVDGDATNEVVVRVEVKAKEGFLFGDRQARRDAEAAQIEARVSGGELTLSLGPEEHGDRHWSERWTIRVPPGFSVSAKLGVGDVTVFDLTGDVRAELGVGDVRVEGTYQSFSDIRAECGVGDATLRTPSGRENGEGFIGHALTSHGPGKSSIRVHAGVGDVKIHLR